MQPLREQEIELVLAMVDASAAVVAPEDREDLFDEFAEDMRESGLVPGAEALDGDTSDAGLVDGHVFLGVGLTVLGQIAFRVLTVATDIAIERGLRDAVAYARRLFTPRGASVHGTDADSADPDAAPDATTDAAAAAATQVAAAVVAAEGDALPPQLDETAVVEIVREQLRALAEAAETRERGDARPA